MLSSSDNSLNQMSSNLIFVDNDTTLSSINRCDFTLLGVEDFETTIEASHVHSTNDNELNVGDMVDDCTLTYNEAETSHHLLIQRTIC